MFFESSLWNDEMSYFLWTIHSLLRVTCVYTTLVIVCHALQDDCNRLETFCCDETQRIHLNHFVSVGHWSSFRIAFNHALLALCKSSFYNGKLPPFRPLWTLTSGRFVIFKILSPGSCILMLNFTSSQGYWLSVCDALRSCQLTDRYIVPTREIEKKSSRHVSRYTMMTRGNFQSVSRLRHLWKRRQHDNIVSDSVAFF